MDDYVHPIPKEYGVPGMMDGQVAFGDAFPFQIASEESIGELNKRLPKGKSVSINRFRPNIVIKNAIGPFDEDFWVELTIGTSKFFGIKSCDRCKITTIDPETGEFSRDIPVFQTLETFRKFGKYVYFGMNLINQTSGETIAVGDLLTVDKRRDFVVTRDD